MAKIVGRNALVYVAGTEVPNRNSVTINFDREISEARVFQNVVAGGPWSDQIPGFRTWTVEINGYYDDADDVVLSQINADAAQLVVAYESRENLGRYWYGYAWFTLSEEIGVDDVVTLNMSGTGTGALTRIPIPS
jgi:hypothetical protein